MKYLDHKLVPVDRAVIADLIQTPAPSNYFKCCECGIYVFEHGVSKRLVLSCINGPEHYGGRDISCKEFIIQEIIK